MTTPNGVPITVCAECHRWLRDHPQGVRHCEACGRPSAFISEATNGLCLGCKAGRK